MEKQKDRRIIRLEVIEIYRGERSTYSFPIWCPSWLFYLLEKLEIRRGI